MSKKNDKKQVKNYKKPLGVIATIKALIVASKGKGVSKDQILEVLINNFPEREAKSLANTVSVQVPSRLSREWKQVVRVGKKYMLMEYYTPPANLINPADLFKD